MHQHLDGVLILLSQSHLSWKHWKKALKTFHGTKEESLGKTEEVVSEQVQMGFHDLAVLMSSRHWCFFDHVNLDVARHDILSCYWCHDIDC